MKSTIITIVLLITAILGIFFTNQYKKTKKLEKTINLSKECATNIIEFHKQFDGYKLEHNIKDGQEIKNIEFLVKEYAQTRGVTLSLTCPNSPNRVIGHNVVNKNKVQFMCSNKTHALGIKITTEE